MSLPFINKQIVLVAVLTSSLYFVLGTIEIILIFPNQNYFPLGHFIVVPFLLLLTALLAYFQKYERIMWTIYIIAPIIATICNTNVIAKIENYTMYTGEVIAIILWVFTVSGLRIKAALLTALIVMHIAAISVMNTHEVNEEFYLFVFWLFSSFFLGFMGAVLLDLSRKNTESKNIELQKELQNKDILLREIQHRVKNNLQVISSLMSIQAKSIDDENIKEIFYKNTHRIQSMSLIHETIFDADDLEYIDLESYITSLIHEIVQVYHCGDIQFDISCKNMTLKIDSALQIGIIIN